jgi:hypothetical protein
MRTDFVKLPTAPFLGAGQNASKQQLRSRAAIASAKSNKQMQKVAGDRLDFVPAVTHKATQLKCLFFNCNG